MVKVADKKVIQVKSLGQASEFIYLDENYEKFCWHFCNA